ncbi:MAG: hypothetical protein ACKOQ2_29230 [Dolichospermum sp.]
MPLDPEILAAIQEAIKTTIPATLPAVIQEAVKPLTEQIEVIEKQQRDVRKLVDTMPESSAKLSEQMAHQFEEKLEEKFAAMNPSLDFLNKLRQQAEESNATPASTEEPLRSTGNEVNVEEIKASLMDQVKSQYESQILQIQQQLDERDKETQILREAERQSRMRNEVLDQMRALKMLHPNTESDLLTLLEKRGLLLEDKEANKLYIKSIDKFGDPAKAEFKDVLPKMLKAEFAHFAVPRDGTGTDATPGSRPTPQNSPYDFSSMTAQELWDRCSKDPEAMKAYDQMLEQQFGKA